MTKLDARKNYRVSKHAISFKNSPSRTQQSFKDECDINYIVKKGRETGLITHINPNLPIYSDNFDVFDYQAAMNIVADANQQFAALPSKLRDRFNNDPAKFLQFMQDPENQEEMIKLGLATKKPEPKEPEPQKVVVVNVNEQNEHEPTTQKGDKVKGSKA